MKNSYLAIVPAFNEQGSVGAVVRAIKHARADFDVVVIDDGSTDDTASQAWEAGAAVISHPFNLGIGASVQCGLQHAYTHDYQVAVQVDGDGQHDPAFLQALLDAIEDGADVAWGSRFIGDGDYPMSFPRRVGRRVFAVIMSLIVRQRITDPTSGFRMLNRRAIKMFALDYPNDYPEVEAIQLMHSSGLVFREVPVRMRERQAGQSSITAAQSVYYMVKVLLAVLIGLFRAPVNEPRPAAASGIHPEPGL